MTFGIRGLFTRITRFATTNGYHLGKMRSSVAQFQAPFNFLFIAAQFGLNSAVGQIAHPAGQSQLTRSAS